MSIFKRKPATNSAFVEFIRNAKSAHKKRVYSEVMKRASEVQAETIRRVKPVAA